MHLPERAEGHSEAATTSATPAHMPPHTPLSVPLHDQGDASLPSYAPTQRPRRLRLHRLWFSVGCALVAIAVLAAGIAHGVSQRSQPRAETLLSATSALSALWVSDTDQSPALYDFSRASAQHIAVAPIFAQYYHAHAGALELGAPLTTVLPTHRGQIQFFANGALLLDTQRPASTPAPAPTASAITVTPTPIAPTTHEVVVPTVLDAQQSTDQYDAATGVTRLALLPRLLTVGSELGVNGRGSSLTYVGVRAAALPTALTRVPGGVDTTGGVFITEAMIAGAPYGHHIPASIWSYLQQPKAFPDGWQTDIGAPLTEALAFTLQRNGKTSHLMAQAFPGALLLVSDISAGPPHVSWANLGVAYLDTQGPPALNLPIGGQLWVTQTTTITNEIVMPSDTSKTTTIQAVHVGLHFPVTLRIGSRWANGILWYAIDWQTPGRRGAGWILASATTNQSPGAVPGSASVDALSDGLASYLAGLGQGTGLAVYDLTRQQYYTYNETTQFIMASSVKVPIMLTLLTMTEQQQRQLTADELNTMTAMIENSDNDAAQALFDEIGGADALNAFMRQVGISGFTGNPDAWGYSVITPLAMAQLLAALQNGAVLNADDRNLALQLMENIEPDQQVGVGDTAPANATVAMKDGWVQDPDNLWAMNSSGIVTIGSETYIIAVYSQRVNVLDDGQAIARQVCGMVAQLLK